MNAYFPFSLLHFFSLIFSLVGRQTLLVFFAQLFDRFWSIWYLSEISMVPYLLRKQETDRELFLVDLRFFWTWEQNCDFVYIFLIFSFKVARRCLSFLHNGVQELSILDINCPQGSVACWVLLSALEVLQTCRDFSQNSTSTQVQQYCFYTAELWSYCREKMLLLGKLIVFTLYITLLNGLHKESNCFSKNFLSDFSFEIVECASIVLQNRKSTSIYLPMQGGLD